MVKVGDVWRKEGPCDWIKVVRVCLPDCPGHDGGAPGCSVRLTNWRGNWERKTWFYPAKDSAEFERLMSESFRKKVPNA